MKEFSSLLHNLILTPSRNTKIKLLQDYFKTLDINRAYALAILSDQLSFKFIKASKLRELVYEQVDQHLFDFSYDYVGMFRFSGVFCVESTVFHGGGDDFGPK